MTEPLLDDVRAGDYSSALYESIKKLEEHNTKLITVLGQNVQNMVALFGNLSELATNSIALARLATDQLAIYETQQKEASLRHFGFKDDPSKIAIAKSTSPSILPMVSGSVAQPVDLNTEDALRLLKKYKALHDEPKGEGEALPQPPEEVSNIHPLTEITPSPVEVKEEVREEEQVQKPKIVTFREMIAGLLEAQGGIETLYALKGTTRRTNLRFYEINMTVFSMLHSLKEIIQAEAVSQAPNTAKFGIAFFDYRDKPELEVSEVSAVIWQDVLLDGSYLLVIPDIKNLQSAEVINAETLRPVRPFELNLQEFNAWVVGFFDKIHKTLGIER